MINLTRNKHNTRQKNAKLYKLTPFVYSKTVVSLRKSYLKYIFLAS